MEDYIEEALTAGSFTLIYSSSYDDNMHHVRIVLFCLRQYQLYAKAKKCEFHKESITFLGYIKSHCDCNEVDGPSCGIVAVLSQCHGNPEKVYPCAYFSLKLTPEERLNLRQAQWVLFFTKFQFTVAYHPGTKNGKVDALSRRHNPTSAPAQPQPILPPLVLLAPIRWNLEGEIQQAQVNESSTSTCPATKLYVPSSLHSQVLQWEHEAPSSGHSGIRHTTALIQNQFWWPSLSHENYIESCATCGQSRTGRQLPTGLLEPLSIPCRPWYHMAVDFVTGLPSSSGFNMILGATDWFSKACWLVPLKGLPTAMEMATTLFNQVFHTYGLLEYIVSDRSPQFTSRVWNAFCTLLGINVSLSSVYRPQSTGPTSTQNTW
ncbi:hypothetical protein QTP86_015339, partial [Hemibagrus guttatus]